MSIDTKTKRWVGWTLLLGVPVAALAAVAVACPPSRLSIGIAFVGMMALYGLRLCVEANDEDIKGRRR